MTIYDISLTLSPDLPTWPGDPGLQLEQFESMDKGAHVNVTRMSSSVHLGTHVDAPHHFLNDGRTVESAVSRWAWVTCRPLAHCVRSPSASFRNACTAWLQLT